MEFHRIFTVIFIFFGDSMIVSNQGLLGTVENLFGLDDGPSDSQQYTTAPTATQNINRNPLRSNLLGNNPNLLNRDPNRRPNSALNNNLPNNKLHNGITNPTVNLFNQQNPTRVQSSVMQKVNQGNYEDNDVKLAAQQFPALQQLLDRLKELNRQKELDKKKELDNLNGVTTEATTTMENNNHNDNESKPKGTEKLKALRKRKFYFQVRPVIPEDERKDEGIETVYYEE